MSNAAQSKIPSEIVATAADWFARLQEEEVAEQDFQEWQRWLSAAPEHQRAYRNMENAWRLIGEVKRIPDPQLSERQVDSTSGRRAAPAGGGVEIGELKKRLDAHSKTHWALAASLTLVLAGAAYWLLAGNPSYSTHIAEQRSVRLDDGSRVTLGASSKVTPLLTDASRRITLNFGEAFFEVAQDPQRPFIVAVGDTEIRALGTAFNVNANKSRVSVKVTEGSVAVVSVGKDREQILVRGADRPGSGSVDGRSGMLPDGQQGIKSDLIVAAGEQVVVGRDGAVETGRANAGAVTWLQGRFEYRGEALVHVIADLNRYTDRHIVLADPTLGNLRYSGTVFPDHLDEWLLGIGGALPVVVRDTGSEREIFAASLAAPSTRSR